MRAGEIRLTRFLRNPHVTPAQMVASAQERLSERSACNHILAIQDTTVVKSSGGGGLYLHACIAVDASDGALLGLAHALFLQRDKGVAQSRQTKAIQIKESHRWLESANEAAKACVNAKQLTIIADRESDIYAAFALRPSAAHMVIRAAQNRCLSDDGRLFDFMDSLPEMGHFSLDIPAKTGCSARKTTLCVRFSKVEIKRPKNSPDVDLPNCLSLFSVDVREVNSPATQVIHWRLLTTHSVETLEDAVKIIELYRQRWQIEQVFRTLKTKGFDIEGLKIENDAPRCNLVMAALIATITVQQLVHARDGHSESKLTPLRPILDVFEEEDIVLLEALSSSLEGKTQKQKNPHPRGSLAFASWVCGRLGGWNCYYGKPGPIVMLNGWCKFQEAKQGVLAMKLYKDV